MRLNGIKESPWVVKIGGRLCEDVALRQELAAACAAVGAPLVLVHGGGAQITRLQAHFGAEPRFHEGRRITEAADLAVVEMALSGSINKDLVRALRAAGCEAVGVSGCDGGLIECALVPSLGRVGVPERVDPALLLTLLAAGWTPVVSPVSAGPDGAAVNVNADEAACALAAALGAERLLLLSDVEAVRIEGENATTLEVAGVEALIASGEIHDGMVPKIRSAALAVGAGVGRVVIGGYAGGSLEGVRGTEIVVTGDGGTGRGGAGSRIDWGALTLRMKEGVAHVG